MKRLFPYILATAVTLVTLLAAPPLLVPASVFKDQIENSITRATGRKFTVAGPLHFAIFPAPAIRAERVALAGIPGGHAPSLVTADDIQLGVRLWPLLFGRLELTRVVLDKPAIALEAGIDGQTNWVFEHAPKAKTGNSGFHISIVPHFSDVEVVHGNVTYANARTGARYKFEDIDAGIDVRELDQATMARGSFTWASRRTSFRANITTPEQFLRARKGNVEISLVSGGARANFSGAVTPDGHISGEVALDTTSFHDDATWLGARMPESSGFGTLSLQSAIEGDNRTVALTMLSAKLDAMHIKGDITLAKGELRPLLEGSLSIDHLDINPYIEHRHRSSVARQVHNADAWNDEPVSLDILRKSDAQLTIKAGTVTVRNLKLGSTTLRIGFREGRLDATLFPMSLYGGQGRAKVNIDTNRPAPVFHNALEFDNVALKPFFTDAIGVKQIEGIGTIRLDLTSSGISPQAIMHGLNGKGSIAFHDGRLRGVDLGAVARAILTLLDDAVKADSFTSYATMSGSFAVTNGVLTNKDFQLTGPVLKTTGAGTVDIGNRSIDFRIVPQASAIVAKQKLSLGVPFRIKGPWKHVRYAADVTGILHGVLDNLETGKAPFKSLFGPSKPKDPNAPKKKHKSIDDALRNMLGIH